MPGLSDVSGLNRGQGLIWLSGGLGGAGLIAPGFSPFSLAIFAAFTTPPTSARNVVIDNFVKALVAGGVWDLLDGLYVFAAADSQAALINWKNPGTFDATAVNAPTFVADRGYTGNGTTQSIDSGFNPSTAPSPHFVQNSAGMFSRIRTAGTGGVFGTGPSTLFDPSFPLLRMNNSIGAFGPAGMNVAAFWSGDRSDSTNVAVYKNGTSFASTAADTSTGVDNALAHALRGGTLFGTHQLSSFGFGAHLDATKQSALAAAELAYMQAVGAA